VTTLAFAMLFAAQAGVSATPPPNAAGTAPSAAASAGAAAPSGSPAAANAAPPEEGAWVLRQKDFTYMGFTSFYSCDSLADRLRTLLKLAGARDDLKVRPRGCASGFNEVTRMPAARLEFYAFVPAAQLPRPAPAAVKDELPAKQLGRDAPKLKRADDKAVEPGVGAWRKVEIDGRGPRREIEPGDCELVEQFTREVLPLFTTRNVDARTRCTPGQRSMFDVQLSFESLGPLPTADVPLTRP
jgi:hypothetical protein